MVDLTESLTGGLSSIGPPLSGLADRFANTPSIALADVGIGLKAGSSVTLRSTLGGAEVEFAGGVPGVVASWAAGGGSALINRCRSSPSFSASEASPSSKVSSRSRSASLERGSWFSNRRPVGDDALE